MTYITPFARLLSHTYYRKIFNLPTSIRSTVRSHSTALRYAEWACLIDQNRTVKFNFDFERSDSETQDDNMSQISHLHDGSGPYNSTRLLKVIPAYAYRNRKMTEKDLYTEMLTKSAKWEDFRNETVGDRDEEMIGSLHCEVLACRGLVSNCVIFNFYRNFTCPDLTPQLSFYSLNWILSV